MASDFNAACRGALKQRLWSCWHWMTQRLCHVTSASVAPQCSEELQPSLQLNGSNPFSPSTQQQQQRQQPHGNHELYVWIRRHLVVPGRGGTLYVLKSGHADDCDWTAKADLREPSQTCCLPAAASPSTSEPFSNRYRHTHGLVWAFPCASASLSLVLHGE